MSDDERGTRSQATGEYAFAANESRFWFAGAGSSHAVHLDDRKGGHLLESDRAFPLILTIAPLIVDDAEIAAGTMVRQIRPQ